MFNLTFYGSALWSLRLTLRHQSIFLCYVNSEGFAKSSRNKSVRTILNTMYYSSNYIIRTVFINALCNSYSCIVFSLVKATGTYNNIAHNATIDN